MGGLAAGGAVAVSVAYFWFFAPKTDAPADDTAHKEVMQQVQELRREPISEDLQEQAVYFSRLAQSYELLRDFAAARDYYIQAQAAVDADNRQNEVVYYEDIARAYEQEGDSAKATEFLSKQKAHLQAFLQAYPDDTAAQDAIKSIDAKIREINQGVVY